MKLSPSHQHRGNLERVDLFQRDRQARKTYRFKYGLSGIKVESLPSRTAADQATMSYKKKVRIRAHELAISMIVSPSQLACDVVGALDGLHGCHHTTVARSYPTSLHVDPEKFRAADPFKD